MTLDNLVAKVTDPYERQARLYPALLALLPLLAIVVLLYAPQASSFSVVLTIAVSCGGKTSGVLPACVQRDWSARSRPPKEGVVQVRVLCYLCPNR